MLTITRNEAYQVLDTLRQAQEDPMLDEEAFEEAIDIMSSVLLGPDIPIEKLVQ